MTDASYVGPYNEGTDANPFSQIAFIARQIMSRMATCTMVKVVAVHGGGVAPIGKVDVQPLVSQRDGQGNLTEHGILHNVPFFRLQGGVNAIICDPAVGDIGLVCFASTDISSAKITGAVGPPGSWRMFDWADGLYFGGFNVLQTPSQYIMYEANDILIVPGSGGVKINGNLHVTGAIDATGNITAGQGGGSPIDLLNHVHKNVTTGTSNTGGPTG